MRRLRLILVYGVLMTLLMFLLAKLNRELYARSGEMDPASLLYALSDYIGGFVYFLSLPALFIVAFASHQLILVVFTGFFWGLILQFIHCWIKK